jgi:hypothetical protein
MAFDTTPEAQHRHDEVFRAMSPEQRVAMAVEMSETAFRLGEEGIRMRHPGYTDEQVRHAAIRLRLGDELFAAAFSGAPLLPA